MRGRAPATPSPLTTDIHTFESLIRPYKVQEAQIPLCDFNSHLSEPEPSGDNASKGVTPEPSEGQSGVVSDEEAAASEAVASPRPQKRKGAGAKPAGDNRKPNAPKVRTLTRMKLLLWAWGLRFLFSGQLR